MCASIFGRSRTHRKIGGAGERVASYAGVIGTGRQDALIRTSSPPISGTSTAWLRRRRRWTKASAEVPLRRNVRRDPGTDSTSGEVEDAVPQPGTRVGAHRPQNTRRRSTRQYFLSSRTVLHSMAITGVPPGRARVVGSAHMAAAVPLGLQPSPRPRSPDGSSVPLDPAPSSRLRSSVS
jgi:hypothetical protein